MQDDDYITDNDNTELDADLAEHGVKDLARDEYYTLDLNPHLDGEDDEEGDTDGLDVANVDPHNFDIATDEPLKSSSIYSDATVVKVNPDYRPRSSNQGGVVDEKDILDQNETTSNVESGHWGIDEGTG